MVQAVGDTTLAALVADAYGLEHVTLELIREGFNDHWWVRSERGEHVLRLYVEGKYYAPTERQLREELAILEHVRSDGVPVAAPVRRLDGMPLARIDGRLACLFEVAPGGVRDRTDWDEPLGARLGDAMGRFYASVDRAALPFDRYTLDLTYLRDQPAHLLEEAMARTGRGDLDRWKPALEACDAIEDLGRERPAFGLIHGDVYPGNVHVTDDGAITLFDFDHCGYGWRAYELASIRLWMPPAAWDAFLTAHRVWREVSDAELAIAPALWILRPVWDGGDIAALATLPGRSMTPEEEAAEVDRVLKNIELVTRNA